MKTTRIGTIILTNRKLKNFFADIKKYSQNDYPAWADQILLLEYTD